MDFISTDPSPFDEAARAECARLLATVVAELSPRQYQVLVMRYRLDLTFTRIGVEMGITQVAAGNLHKRALAQIERRLADRGIKEFRDL